MKKVYSFWHLFVKSVNPRSGEMDVVLRWDQDKPEDDREEAIRQLTAGGRPSIRMDVDADTHLYRPDGRLWAVVGPMLPPG